MPTMDAPHPVSETSATETLMIARVHKDLVAQLRPNAVSDDLLNYLASTEVHALWSRPVKTFIPLLALRAARQRLETLYGGEICRNERPGGRDRVDSCKWGPSNSRQLPGV